MIRCIYTEQRSLNLNFNRKLNLKESIFAIIFVLLFISFVVSPIWTHGEPDKNLLILISLIGFLFVISNLFFDFSEDLAFNLPENYSELKQKYGKPLKTIHPLMSKMGRKFYSRSKMFFKMDIYNNFIIISYFNYAILIDKKESIRFNNYGLFGAVMTVYYKTSNLELDLSVFQYTSIKKYLQL